MANNSLSPDSFTVVSFRDGYLSVKFDSNLKIGELAEMMAEMVNDKNFIKSICEGYGTLPDTFIGILTRHNNLMLIIHPHSNAEDVTTLYSEKLSRNPRITKG